MVFPVTAESFHLGSGVFCCAQMRAGKNNAEFCKVWVLSARHAQLRNIPLGKKEVFPHEKEARLICGGRVVQNDFCQNGCSLETEVVAGWQ